MDDSNRDSREPSSTRGADGSPGDSGVDASAPSTAPGASITDRLDHVIDDTGGRDDAVAATVNQLLAGVSFEEATAQLLAAGWSLESAESVVEEAREATKRQRGVRTREDVVIDASRKFGKTIRRVRWIIIIGIVIVGIAVWMILNRGE